MSLLSTFSLFIKKNKRAFTLVELLVSIAIMTIILGITLSGGPQSVMKLSLSNSTNEIELMLREAQLQGSAINSFNGLYGGVGVFFDRATSSNVVKFRDTVIDDIYKAIDVGNGLFDQLNVNEKESVYILTNNHKVATLCIGTSTESLYCNNEYTEEIKNLTFSFNRPKQTAHIYINNSTTTDHLVGCIQVESFKSPLPGYVKSITVFRSGMIVKKTDKCK